MKPLQTYRIGLYDPVDPRKRVRYPDEDEYSDTPADRKLLKKIIADYNRICATKQGRRCFACIGVFPVKRRKTSQGKPAHKRKA